MDAGAWDERYREQELVWPAAPNAFVVDEVAGLPPGRVLDLGCGEGRHASWLAERGWRVTAIDFSEVAITKARQLAERRGVQVTWITADLVDDPPSLEPVELVLIAYLQLPRHQLRRVLHVAASLVAPGGTLVLVAHALSNLERGYGGPQDPDVLATLDEVIEALTDAALAVVRGEEVTRTVETDDGEREAIDLLVRAVRPAV